MLLDGLDGRDAKDVGANLNRVRLSVPQNMERNVLQQFTLMEK